jgi:glycosyltransferase involved in cell wall biosynthesis
MGFAGKRIFVRVRRIYFRSSRLGYPHTSTRTSKKNGTQVPFVFIVGDGEYLPTLKSLAENLGVANHITWAGNIPHEEVRSAINACNMMLIPIKKESLELKGSSALKLWEYLACDKPILASEFSDHQFLEKLKLGKMVALDNIELWAETMALEADKKDFLLQGRGGKFIKEEHSYDSVVEKFNSISIGPKAV